MIIVVMGVCSSGKTLIGGLLAKKLGLPFYDGDNFHSESNISKMREGIALDDKDRLPWLKNIANNMQKWDKDGGAVVACSALKNTYRDILRTGSPDLRFVYLKGSKEMILNRIKNRKGHFFPDSLVDSQFATLEEPEDAIVIDITLKPEIIVEDIVKKLYGGQS
jgi:carbohydrate kinase (thermoresistant glucokinase family)